MGSFSILNNIATVNGQRQLNIINVRLGRTLNRLASGRRINSGADDAAGLQVADSLRGNVYALNQAARNASDGIGFLQIADGALQEITNMLIRAVTLAEEAANELVSSTGLGALDAEFQAIQAEIARVALHTNYNGMNIFIHDAYSAGYASLQKQIDSLNPVTDAAQIAALRAEQDVILAAATAKAQSIAGDPGVVVTGADILAKARDNRALGETLDVFVGDLSAVSYVTVNLGFITVDKVAPLEPVIVPLDEVIMSHVRADAGNPPVDASGRFKFYATNKNGEAQLLPYNSSGNPTTSWPAIKVNGNIYHFWSAHPDRGPSTLVDSSPSSAYSDGVWSTTYNLTKNGLDLTIVQKVSVVANPADIGGESYKIDYEVTNNNPGNVTFSLMYNVETQLGTNRNAPLVIDDDDVEYNETYTGSGIPGQVEVFDKANDPLINGVATVNGTGGLAFTPGSEPDRLNVGNFRDVGLFDGFPVGMLAGTNGYSVIWENRVAATGTPVVMTTYYGVKNPPADALDALGYKIIGDKIITGWVRADESKAIDKIIMFNGNNSTGLYNVNLLTHENAVAALASIKSVLNEVSVMRGAVGAGMNRLQAAISVIQTQASNTLAAESQIRDANMAEEISNLTKCRILAETGMAALAHSNSISRMTLKLLR